MATKPKAEEQAGAGAARLKELDEKILIRFSDPDLKFEGESFRLGTNGKFASMTSDPAEGTWTSMAFSTEHYKLKLTREGNLTVTVAPFLIANYKLTDKGVEMKEMRFDKPNEQKATDLIPEVEAFVQHLRECGAFELQKK